MPLKVAVIINKNSGSVTSDVTADTVRQAFAFSDAKVSIKLAADGAEFVKYIDEAAQSDIDVLVGGGGDGTISYAASMAYKHKKILGVLPLGTLNNFAKDLGIPIDTAQAVDVILQNNIRGIDIAEVNGKTFINNSSIGLYPNMVRRREKRQRLGYGKWTSAIWASLRMFKLSPFLKVSITLDGKTFVRKTPFVFVGNNEYDMEFYKIGRRDSLDQGQLSVYFLHKGGRVGVIKLLFKTVFGGLQQWRDFEIVKTEHITIRSRRKKLYTAFDGEVELIETPLNYRIIPKGLRVLTPQREDVQ